MKLKIREPMLEMLTFQFRQYQNLKRSLKSAEELELDQEFVNQVLQVYDVLHSSFKTEELMTMKDAL